MPRSRNWLVYPEAFHDFLRVAVTKRVEIPLDSETEAKRLLGRLYAFFGALSIEAKLPNGDPEARVLRHLSFKVKLHVEGSTLVGYPADEEPLARKMSEILGHQADTPLVSDAHQGPSPGLLENLKKEMKKDGE